MDGPMVSVIEGPWSLVWWLVNMVAVAVAWVGRSATYTSKNISEPCSLCSPTFGGVTAGILRVGMFVAGGVGCCIGGCIIVFGHNVVGLGDMSWS